MSNQNIQPQNVTTYIDLLKYTRQFFNTDRELAAQMGISASIFSRHLNGSYNSCALIISYTYKIVTEILNPPCKTFKEFKAIFPNYYRDEVNILNGIESNYRLRNQDLDSTIVSSVPQNLPVEISPKISDGCDSISYETGTIHPNEETEKQSVEIANKILDQLFDSEKIDINSRYIIERAIDYEKYNIYPYRFSPKNEIDISQINIAEIHAANRNEYPPYIICIVFMDHKLNDEQKIQLLRDFSAKNIWIVFVCDSTDRNNVPSEEDLNAKGCILSYADNHFHLHYKGQSKRLYKYLKKYGANTITQNM